MTNALTSHGIADPDDMRLLSRVLDQVFSDHYVERGSALAEAIAAAALSLYRNGVAEQHQLVEGLAEFIRRRSR